MSLLEKIKNAVSTMFGGKKTEKSKIVIKEVSKRSKAYPKTTTAKSTETSVEKAPKAERTPKPERTLKTERTIREPRSKGPRDAVRKEFVRNNAPLIEDFVAEEWDAEASRPEAVEGKTCFAELDLNTALLRAVNNIGFQYCTDIQAQILPHSLKGADVTGKAQTGTGKTATFLLTILQHLITHKPAKNRKEGAPRALIMAPTRELVMQIEKDARELSSHTTARILSIFGGMDYEKQKSALENDYVDIVIATPGRILDYYKQKVISLDRVEVLVLDEADRMLDMGFLPDMRRIIDATPPKSNRQTMLFSATFPQEIARLAAMWQNSPISVEIEPEHITNADVEQLAYIVSNSDKYTLLYNLLVDMKITRAIIFSNRKDQVRRLTDKLKACDFLCGMLTGDVSQTRRIKTLENFRTGKINLLVATDVAGRGIHVDNIEAVFNYTLPTDPDDYVHRIGRTGRAGAKGISISFASEEDSYMLPEIEEHIKLPLKYITPDEALMAQLPEKFDLKMKNLKRSKPSGGGKRYGDSFDKKRVRKK